MDFPAYQVLMWATIHTGKFCPKGELKICPDNHHRALLAPTDISTYLFTINWRYCWLVSCPSTTKILFCFFSKLIIRNARNRTETTLCPNVTLKVLSYCYWTSAFNTVTLLIFVTLICLFAGTRLSVNCLYMLYKCFNFPNYSSSNCAYDSTVQKCPSIIWELVCSLYFLSHWDIKYISVSKLFKSQEK